MRIWVFIIIAITGCSTSNNQQQEFRIQFHDKVFYDVIAMQGNQEINVSHFNPWEQVKDLSISPDSNYFFYRHKSDSGRVFKLTLHKTTTFEKIAEITPGFGGSFEWNTSNQIIHTWGCGSNCANLRVYNLQLREVFYSLSSGGFYQNKAKDIVIQPNMLGSTFWVYDLRTTDNGGAKCFIDSTSLRTIEGEYLLDFWSLEFLSDYRFRINDTSGVASSNSKYYNIDSIELTNIQPKETGEFYKRIIN